MLSSMRVVYFSGSLLLLAVALLGQRLAYAQSTTQASPTAGSGAPPAGSAAAPAPTASAKASLDTRVQCVAEHEQSQIARMKESLVAARAAALRCSQEECPALLRADCVQWFTELDREVPSVVISVRAGASDISGATVQIDGHTAPHALEGQLLELDPGPHLVEVLRAGEPALERRVVLAAGEKARLLVFEVPGNTSPTAAVPLSPLPPRPTHRPVPTMTWVLSGSALAAAGTASVLGLLALSERNQLERAPEKGGCSPYCSDAQVAPVHHLTLAADVLFGLAAASAVGAGLSYFLRPELPLASGHLQLDLAFAPGGANLAVRGAL
jgi:hypothetical protein